MTDLLWLSDDQLDRIKPYFPLSHGVPRVDDHRVVSGIVFVIKNGLRWRDAPGSTVRTRPCITGLFAGAGWVSSTAFLRTWQADRDSQTSLLSTPRISKRTGQRRAY